jgi:predicted ATP-grasp superfamily ATP-dependent carboligase
MKKNDIIGIWIGPHATDALAIDLVMPTDIIIACDYGSDVQEIEKQKLVISLEKLTKIKSAWTTSDLNYLIQDEIQNILLQKIPHQNARIQFVCHSASGSLEQFIENKLSKAHNLSLSIKQKLYFDDKILLHHQLQLLEIQEIPSLVTYLGNITYTKAIKILGERLVIRLSNSVSGGGVFYVDNEVDFDIIQEKYYSSIVLLESFVEGVSINIQGVISHSKTILGASSIQIIGPKECTNKRFGWCGNDFYTDDHVSDDFLKQAYHLAEIVSNYMNSKGYIGIFGIDLLLDQAKGKVYVLEINPRFQGSTAILTQLEFLNNTPSFLLEHHLSAFNKASAFLEPSVKIFDSKGSLLVLQNTSQHPVLVKKTLQPGVYKFFDGDIVRCRDGLSLIDCQSQDEFILSGGIPFEDQVIMPGSSILWIQTFKKTLQEPQKGILSEEISSICKAIRDKLEFVHFMET